MDRIQKLAERVGALEGQKIRPPIIEYSSDKPKLAASLFFLAWMLLFCTGLFLGWHWGWLVAIGVTAASMAVGTLDP